MFDFGALLGQGLEHIGTIFGLTLLSSYLESLIFLIWPKGYVQGMSNFRAIQGPGLDYGLALLPSYLEFVTFKTESIQSRGQVHGVYIFCTMPIFRAIQGSGLDHAGTKFALVLPSILIRVQKFQVGVKSVQGTCPCIV